MPEECASIRSIARWVLPVLVGPSTAVTPEPGARAFANVGAEEEKAMFYRCFFTAGAFRHCETTGRCKAPSDDKLREAIRESRHSGVVRQHQTRNLEIPG